MRHDDKYLEDFGMEVPPHHPLPIGYKVLVMPYGGPETTDGGIIIPDEVKDVQKFGSMVAYVVMLGPMAFTGDKFGGVPWFAQGDWVMIGKYNGNRFMYEGVEMRLINDDEFIATVADPTKVKRFSI